MPKPPVTILPSEYGFEYVDGGTSVLLKDSAIEKLKAAGYVKATPIILTVEDGLLTVTEEIVN